LLARFSVAAHWGTGKYRSFRRWAARICFGADMVTVAVRRLIFTYRSKESFSDFIDREKMFILPNTAAVTPLTNHSHRAAWREVGLSNGSAELKATTNAYPPILRP